MQDKNETNMRNYCLLPWPSGRRSPPRHGREPAGVRTARPGWCRSAWWWWEIRATDHPSTFTKEVMNIWYGAIGEPRKNIIKLIIIYSSLRHFDSKFLWYKIIFLSWMDPTMCCAHGRVVIITTAGTYLIKVWKSSPRPRRKRLQTRSSSEIKSASFTQGYIFCKILPPPPLLGENDIKGEGKSNSRKERESLMQVINKIYIHLPSSWDCAGGRTRFPWCCPQMRRTPRPQTPPCLAGATARGRTLPLCPAIRVGPDIKAGYRISVKHTWNYD